jgi:hypothetical protein
MWNVFLAVALGIHGLIHIIGVLVNFKLVDMKDNPYKTTLLVGRWEIGERGTRIFGVVWLVIMIGYVVGIIGLTLDQSWWYPLTIAITAVSLVICILDVPGTKFGLVINIVLLILLAIGPNVGWVADRINF